MTKPLTKESILRTLREELPNLRERFGVERIALYGSFAKGDFTEGSDVDVLIHLSRPLGLEFVALAEHLEKVLGRKVDLATFETLQRSVRHPRYRTIASNIVRSLIYVQEEA